MDKRYQVFISSTFADLKDERAKVTQALMEIDCIPAGMEVFPAIDQEQFEFIKRIIDDCDYYLLIIGGRYGSISEDGLSYTEKEYDYAVEKGIKVVALLHGNPETIPMNKSEMVEESRTKLNLFRQKVATNRLVKFWNNADELSSLVAMNLPKTIKTYPAIGWVRANTVGDPSLYQELNELRKENISLKEKLRIEQDKEIEFKEDIATLEDKITVKGRIRRYYNKRDNYTDWKVTLSWQKIFSLVAPYLLEHPSDDNAKSLVGKQIYLSEHESPSGSILIDDQDFQTVKIHLKTLGLTDLRYTKSTNGSMALFWRLTALGEEMLIKLRSVKKSNE